MRRVLAVLTAVILFCVTSSVFAVGTADDGNQDINLSASQLVAFPGAEGGGMYTTGARAAASPTVYHVTKLTDDGSEGTLRDAVSKDNRIIVFDVAGNIELKSTLNISKSNLTILGQTAPGDGICIKDANVYITGSNIIMRYLRFRMGTANLIDDDSLGGKGGENIIIDHVSTSWSTDECLSIYAVKNLTVQWSVISNALNHSLHDEGGGVQDHGYGGIWGGVNSSFHHNLLANCISRFPRIGTSETVSSYKNGADTESLIDMRNNVIYNWKSNTSYGGENGVRVNIVNNYYKEGPASSSIRRFYEMYGGKKGGVSNWGTDLAIGGNYYDPRSQNSTVDEINLDNTKGVSTKKVDVFEVTEYSDDDASHAQYIKDYPIGTQTAQDAYVDVLNYAGASKARDSVDALIVENTRNRTAVLSDGTAMGANGIIDSPDEIGGWPNLAGTKAVDTDGDGIPDEWEDLNGLNKNNAADALQKNAEGYFNIEAYANDIVTPGDVEIADKTELNRLIAQAREFNESEYTAETWSALETVFAQAQSVTATLYPTQAQVDKAAAELSDAIKGLVRDYKSTLKNKLNEANGYIYDARYTNASRWALQNTVDSAQRVYDNGSATDKEVEDAVMAIETAISALELLPTQTVKGTLANLDFNDGISGASVVSADDKGDDAKYYYQVTAAGELANVSATYVQRAENDLAVYLKDNSSRAANQLVVPIETQSSGVVEVSADLKFDDSGSKMSFFTLCDTEGAVVAAIGRPDSSIGSVFAYRDMGSVDVSPLNEVTVSKNTWYTFKIKYDLDTKKVSAYIGDAALVEDYSSASLSSDIASFTVQGSIGSTTRHISLDNVNITGEITTPVEDITSPTPRPSDLPSPPTPEPSENPTEEPTTVPTQAPTSSPSDSPTASPVQTSTPSPTLMPTFSPSTPEPGFEGIRFDGEPALSGNTVTANLYNDTSDNEDIIYLIASYSSDGMLIDAQYVTVAVSKSSQTIERDVKTEAGGKVKVFLWKQNLEPVDLKEII